MVYRMTVRSNPRLLIVPLVVLVLFGLSLAAFSAGPFLGIAGLAVTAYIAYVLFRFVSKQLRCTVEVVDGGVRLDLYGEEKISLEWGDVTHRGVATDSRRRRLLFLYRESADKLLVVPDEFERFDALLAEVLAHGELQELTLEANETIKDRLRVIVGGGEGPLEDEEPTPPPS